MWVNARRDHLDFHDQDARSRYRGRGAARPAGGHTAIPEAKGWFSTGSVNEVGSSGHNRAEFCLSALAEYMIGGSSAFDLPNFEQRPRVGPRVEGHGQYRRRCQHAVHAGRRGIYNGVTLNPLYWPARQGETLLMKAIYTFHPHFIGATT
jgi:arginine deiminase